MSVVQALVNAKAFKAEDFPRAYLESQKFLITASDGTRRIHPIAAYVLLALHPADNKAIDPLLFRVGQSAVALRTAVANANASTLQRVIVAYQQLQTDLQELDKRQEAIARLTAMFSAAAINKEALGTVAAGGKSYIDLLKEYKLTETADPADLFSDFLAQLKAGQSVYRSLSDVKALEIPGSFMGLMGGTPLFPDSTKQHVKASLQSAASSQK